MSGRKEGFEMGVGVGGLSIGYWVKIICGVDEHGLELGGAQMGYPFVYRSSVEGGYTVWVGVW